MLKKKEKLYSVILLTAMLISPVVSSRTGNQRIGQDQTALPADGQTYVPEAEPAESPEDETPVLEADDAGQNAEEQPAEPSQEARMETAVNDSALAEEGSETASEDAAEGSLQESGTDVQPGSAEEAQPPEEKEPGENTAQPDADPKQEPGNDDGQSEEKPEDKTEQPDKDKKDEPANADPSVKDPADADSEAPKPDEGDKKPDGEAEDKKDDANEKKDEAGKDSEDKKEDKTDRKVIEVIRIEKPQISEEEDRKAVQDILDIPMAENPDVGANMDTDWEVDGPSVYKPVGKGTNRKIRPSNIDVEYDLLPDFSNDKAWAKSSSPYNTPYLWGQCTWFAWGRFYEMYGFNPGFSGNGYSCAEELVNAHPDKFRLSSVPASGSVFSVRGNQNHVGMVMEYDEDRNIMVIQEGNLDGISNPWNEAIEDWRTLEVSPAAFKQIYHSVIYAVPKDDYFGRPSARTSGEKDETETKKVSSLMVKQTVDRIPDAVGYNPNSLEK